MAPYLFRRLLIAVPTLLGITLLTFLLIHLAPGDPMEAVESSGERTLSPEALAKMRAVYHLDEPIGRQYLRWLSGLARLDLGVSLYDGEPVARKIAYRLPATFALTIASTLLAWIVAIPVGMKMAARPGGAFDRRGQFILYSLYSLPVFWGGLLLQLVFAVHLRWLPLQGLESDLPSRAGVFSLLEDRASHLILPAVCMAYVQIAYLSRFVRAGLIDALASDYVRTARAKGLPERKVLRRHALANALLPLITIAGFTLPSLAAGSVIVERIFSWPGAGRLLFDSIQRRDLTTFMGLTVVAAVLTLAGMLLADILYVWADPRIRYDREAAD